jgi:Protein of unknown function (DUF3515)
VLVPVVVVLVVVVRVLGGDGGGAGDGAVAEVEGTPAPQREDLPPLPVDVPPVTPQADADCPALMGALPLDLSGAASRPVQSDSPFAYAWGDPPVVLVCGVDRPAGFVATAGLIQINGVQWFVDTTDPDTVVWTTVDRAVYVQVSVPGTVDSGPVTVLSTLMAKTLPFQQPQPGP